MYSSLRNAALLLTASTLIRTSVATPSVSSEILERLAARGETLESIQVRTVSSMYCSPGDYWQVFFGSYGFCLDCPAGSWCPGGNNAPENDCPAGTHNTHTGSTSSTACTACPANYYSSIPGSTTCDKCDNGYTSSAGSSKCTAVNSHRPRSMKMKRAGAQCKAGFMSCAILSGRGGTECVDVDNDLESCGGCVGYEGEGAGVDCTSIPGVSSVQCVVGQCVVDACARGYKVSKSGTSCEPAAGLLTQAKRFRRQNQSRPGF